ncbi:aldehyde oxidAse and xanthine dehydrogenase, a/b hammerhead domain protein [delta proteobacterium NaphS2]|nr:aldehyde oxidAse and xanthine dehydrogenase, a/b hammerhead domain protein [delta proteobacterium NaphS2]
MANAYRYLGKNLPRKDATDIVTGRATFLDDFKPAGMLYGKALRSPHPHALITHIDVSEARQLPNVHAVLTHKDVPPEWLTGLPNHRAVLDRKVRHVGDGVALVAAKTPEIALKALRLIKVEYEVLQPVFDVDEAVKPGAPQLYEQFPGNEFTPGCPVFSPEPFNHVKRGNIEEGFKEADFVVEGTYGYEKFPCPLPPESPAIIARWDTPTDVTIWATTQSPTMLKLIMETKMGDTNIRCISFNVGGSYGNKQTVPMPVFYAAALAKAANRPVKFSLSKAEQLLTYDLRLSNRVHAKIGVRKDGSVSAVQGEWLVDTGVSSDLGQGQIAVGLGEAQVMMAKCKNWDLEGRLIATNRSASGICRGFGGQELKSALIPLWGQAMKKGHLDPVECFKKNFVQPGDGYFWRDGKWWVCREVDYVKTMEETAKKFGWREKWKGWNTPTSVNGTKAVGVGVGVHGNADAGEDESEAYVRLDPFGNAILQCCVAESGMGQRNSLCKMVAEIVQVPLESVRITPSDTLVNPFDFGLAGSRGSRAIGSACTRAASDAIRQLLERAAPVLKVTPEELATKDGMIFVKNNPEITIPWIAVMGPMNTITGMGHYEADYSMPNFMIFFVEVEVDLETGQVEILNIAEGTDVGRIIDPLNLKMQFHGAFGSAGVDSAIYEESILDTETGRIMTGNMIDYKWRPFTDFPPFDTVVLESEFDTHVFKAIGVGEITGAPAPGAILMAISNAVGVDIMDYPATPAVILKTLGKS